jgi:hypothetical protein
MARTEPRGFLASGQMDNRSNKYSPLTKTFETPLSCKLFQSANYLISDRQRSRKVSITTRRHNTTRQNRRIAASILTPTHYQHNGHLTTSRCGFIPSSPSSRSSPSLPPSRPPPTPPHSPPAPPLPPPNPAVSACAPSHTGTAPAQPSTS